MWIVLGCMPSLLGNNEKISSNKTDSSPVTSEKVSTNDIERPLLRPVELKKEDTHTKDQKTGESMPNSQAEQCIESIMSILRAERQKLQELENEYKKLEKDVTEEGNAKNYETDVNKEIKSVLSSAWNEPPQSGEKSALVGTSSTVAGRYPLKDASIREGSSTVQLYTKKNDKKPEVGINNDLNQRLSKAIGNANLLDLAECFYKLCEYDNALQTYKLLTPTDTSLDQYIWAQYQIANCYRNMKKFDLAFSEYQRFVSQYPNNDLIEQVKWYIDDVNWWKSWREKSTSTNTQLLAASNNYESKE